MVRPPALPQPLRLTVALAYVALLLPLALFLNGQLLPPFGVEGLWFYAAFAALILGEFIIEPFFTRPADAIANGVALVLGAAAASLEGAAVSSEAASAGRTTLVGYGLVVIALAIIAITFKDRPNALGRAAPSASHLAGRLGRARWMYTLVLFAVGYAAFADSADKIAALYLTWFAIFVLSPLEWLVAGIASFRQSRPSTDVLATVERIEDPHIFVARMPRGQAFPVGSRVDVGEDAGISGTVVDATTLLDEPRMRLALDRDIALGQGQRLRLSGQPSSELVVGHVAEGTQLDELKISSSSDADPGLAEGRLVQARIRDEPVLYQVTEALVTSERETAWRRDLVEVTARKLGIWNSERSIFQPVPWIPDPGTPVILCRAPAQPPFAPDVVGHVPGTEYGISVDLDYAVTHNTAILGILGIGKTYLAYELIQRMLVDGIKVVVLDITDRYSEHLSDIFPPGAQDSLAANIESTISPDYLNRTERNGEAGNRLEFAAAINHVLGEFKQGDERLLILNPNRFDVSRMEGRPFQGSANLLVDLTMVEVTRIVAETILELFQGPPDPDLPPEQAKVCLVLEEAHSLIPEWNSTINEAERQAVNGTARALLQGRKYGYGSLVITQRTANVTKSILNQCNTVFALRVYDATGMGFLENYIGPHYARLLASLLDRQAVVYGRASSCNAPIIVQLNNADRFREGYWADRSGDVPRTPAPADARADDEPRSDSDVDHPEGGQDDGPPF